MRDRDCKGEGKAIPLQAWTGPEDSRRLRLPDFKTIGTWKWYGCQPYAPAAFTPRKYSWYSFLLQAESTPGPQCGRKITIVEEFYWKIFEEICFVIWNYVAMFRLCSNWYTSIKFWYFL